MLRLANGLVKYIEIVDPSLKDNKTLNLYFKDSLEQKSYARTRLLNINDPTIYLFLKNINIKPLYRCNLFEKYPLF